MAISLFFYSNYCQHCKQIVREINKSVVSSSIRYVCIDSQNVRDKLPQYIKSVPSLVVGDTNQIFVGNQILGWLQMQSLVQKQTNTTPHSISQTIQQPVQEETVKQIEQPVQSREPIGPNAWHNSEMNAFSDSYSFIDIDTSTKGDGGMSMIHNFETLSGNGANIPGSIMAPGGAPSNPSMPVQYGNPITNPVGNNGFGNIQLSEKAELLNKQMEDMMNRRELDVPNVPARV